jgi:chemotaxis regulatin CheY-phosphate phosphatase CheZ
MNKGLDKLHFAVKQVITILEGKIDVLDDKINNRSTEMSIRWELFTERAIHQETLRELDELTNQDVDVNSFVDVVVHQLRELLRVALNTQFSTCITSRESEHIRREVLKQYFSILIYNKIRDIVYDLNEEGEIDESVFNEFKSYLDVLKNV